MNLNPIAALFTQPHTTTTGPTTSHTLLSGANGGLLNGLGSLFAPQTGGFGGLLQGQTGEGDGSGLALLNAEKSAQQGDILSSLGNLLENSGNDVQGLSLEKNQYTDVDASINALGSVLGALVAQQAVSENGEGPVDAAHVQEVLAKHPQLAAYAQATAFQGEANAALNKASNTTSDSNTGKEAPSINQSLQRALKQLKELGATTPLPQDKQVRGQQQNTQPSQASSNPIEALATNKDAIATLDSAKQQAVTAQQLLDSERKAMQDSARQHSFDVVGEKARAKQSQLAQTTVVQEVNKPVSQNPNAAVANQQSQQSNGSANEAAQFMARLGEEAVKPASGTFTQDYGSQTVDEIQQMRTQDVHQKVSGAEFRNHGTATQQSPAEQILVRISQMAQTKVNQLTVQLEPAELGKVDVKIEWSANDHSARIMVVAEKSETLEMLRQDSRSLERALQDAVKADSSSLSFNLRGEQQQQQGSGRSGDFAGLGQDMNGVPYEQDLGAAQLATHYSGSGALDIRV